MKKNLIAIFSIIVLFFLNDPAVAQKKKTIPKGKSSTVAKSVQTFTVEDFLGAFAGNIYTNKFFGIKLATPEGWIIQESQVNKAIKDMGSNSLKGKTSQTQKKLDEAVDRLTVFFTVSREAFGVPNNASMVFSAERSDPAAAPFASGKDYLQANIRTFKLMTLPPDFKYSQTIKSEKLGNETFYYLDIERAVAYQRFYAVTRKGYALFYTLTYGTEEDLETIKESIRNSDFSWKE